VREEAVAAGQIDDAAAAEETAHPSSGFPCFVEFFSRQASGFAHGSTDAIEQRIARKSFDVVRGQPALRRSGEQSGRVYHAVNT